MNYKAKINLAQLDGAVTAKVGPKNKQVEVLAIPADKFYIGAKGIYLDAIAFNIKTRKNQVSHIVSKSVDKEARKRGVQGENLGYLSEIPLPKMNKTAEEKGDLF